MFFYSILKVNTFSTLLKKMELPEKYDHAHRCVSCNNIFLILLIKFILLIKLILLLYFFIFILGNMCTNIGPTCQDLAEEQLLNLLLF